MGALLLGWLDRLLPPRTLAAPPDELLRVRLLVGFTVVTMLTGLAAALAQALFGAWLIMAIILACAGALAVGVAVLRQWGSLAFGAHWVAGCAMAAVTGTLIVRGGLGRSVQLALVVPPLLALVTAGRRARDRDAPPGWRPAGSSAGRRNSRRRQERASAGGW